jgi:Tfp pilus assembly protein PilN
VRHNLLEREGPALLTGLLWAAAAAVLLIVVLQAVSLRARVHALERQIGSLQAQERSVEAAADAAERRAAPYREAAAIGRGLADQEADPGLVRRLESAVPGDVWLSSLTMSRETVVIDGRALSAGSIARAVAAMRTVPGVADARVTVVTRSAQGIYEFHMTLQPAQAGARSQGPGATVTPDRGAAP